ncbi:MAG: hypothetical protein WD396_06220, partial [Pseudohongiellaceae bacterium]
VEAASKANLVRNEAGQQTLELRIDFERAWVQVREALEDADLEVIASNREESLFTVRFAGIVSEEDGPGLIGRLLRRGDNEAAPQPREFSVRLQQNGGMVTVLVEPLESGPETAQLGSDLLQVISDNLG